MALAFAITVANFYQMLTLPDAHRYLYTHAWQMVRIGSLDITFSFAMDPLSGLMCLIVTGVGSLIHIYAASYMEKEPAYWRFFCYLNLFIFSMLLLILGDNMIVMFFGWEGVGLCSYLLIGFWYKDYSKATAGMKAFVVNRVGDWGFICGMALLFWGLGGVWMASTGDFMPDYRDRFIPVQKELIEGNPATAHDDDAHASAPAPVEEQPDLRLAQNQPHPPHPGAGHGQRGKQGAPPGRRPGGLNRPGIPKKPKEQRLAGTGKPGLMTMTTHAGARVYFGVSELDHLFKVMGQLEPCSSKEAWDKDQGHQLLASCYAESPFIRKRLAPGVHQVIVVPGGGAVTRGDGNEFAKFNARVESERETVIAVVGPTMTFREIHDQLAIYDRGTKLRLTVSGAPEDDEIELPSIAWTAVEDKGGTFTLAADNSFTLDKEHMWKLARGQPVELISSKGHIVTVERPAIFKDPLKEKKVWGIALITLACLCFFIGATGKSAQVPLYVWLPDAMAGPTPVSALIHAATMVTAGVYMVARMNFLFGMTPTASGVVALIGAITALFAATMGFFQYDIKRVLAYSTVSQLGFMFIGVGVGAYWAGVFHLMTHAFFKACLFLGSGSVIHGMHAVEHDADEAQDMRNMGGLRAVMPDTAKTYWFACMAITAVPPGLAGFWSKDEILWKAFNTQHTGIVPGWFIYTLGLLAALGTSFYMWRSYYLTFEGKHANRDIAKKVHESPKAMTYVLWILAGLSIVSGVIFGISSHFVGGIDGGLLPYHATMEHWLDPVMAHTNAVVGDAGYFFMYGLMALSVVGAIGAWGLALRLYGSDRPKNWAAIEQARPGFTLLHNKYYVDEIYDATFVASFRKLRMVFAEMDRWIVDGIVNGAAVVGRGMAWVAGVIDKFGVDGAVNVLANGTLKAGQKLRGVQTGRVQTYVYGILGGVAFLAIIQYFLG